MNTEFLHSVLISLNSPLFFWKLTYSHPYSSTLFSNASKLSVVSADTVPTVHIEINSSLPFIKHIAVITVSTEHNYPEINKSRKRGFNKAFSVNCA